MKKAAAAPKSAGKAAAAAAKPKPAQKRAVASDSGEALGSAAAAAAVMLPLRLLRLLPLLSQSTCFGGSCWGCLNATAQLECQPSNVIFLISEDEEFVDLAGSSDEEAAAATQDPPSVRALLLGSQETMPWRMARCTACPVCGDHADMQRTADRFVWHMPALICRPSHAHSDLPAHLAPLNACRACGRAASARRRALPPRSCAFGRTAAQRMRMAAKRPMTRLRRHLVRPSGWAGEAVQQGEGRLGMSLGLFSL